MLGAFALLYAFIAMFVLSSLRRNRREERLDAPVLTIAGHGLMAASATGGLLMLGAVAWASVPL